MTSNTSPTATSTYTLAASLNHAGADSALNAALSATVTHIDAHQLVQFDTSVLAVLMRCKAAGKTLCNLPHRVGELAQLYGVTALL